MRRRGKIYRFTRKSILLAANFQIPLKKGECFFSCESLHSDFAVRKKQLAFPNIERKIGRKEANGQAVFLRKIAAIPKSQNVYTPFVIKDSAIVDVAKNGFFPINFLREFCDKNEKSNRAAKHENERRLRHFIAVVCGRKTVIKRKDRTGERKREQEEYGASERVPAYVVFVFYTRKREQTKQKSDGDF